MERETQFIGQSAAFQDAVDRASQAATLDRPVLVIGERGTGKELIAERLHRLSARWAPWRSVAARLFWAYHARQRGRDLVPVA